LLQKGPYNFVLLFCYEEGDECQPPIYRVPIIIIIWPLPTPMSYQMSLKNEGIVGSRRRKEAS
jgi:hypothetical protein